MKPAPQQVDGMVVVAWSPIDARHRATGKARHFVAGAAAPVPAGLAICRDEGAFYLFRCDPAWRVIADTWHPDLASARAQAEFEFAGVTETWLP